MSKSFDELWEFITKRRLQVVQERSELEHVFNLIQGCESYLEIGTAEGDSLYVLSHALRPNSKITSVDLGETGTRTLAEQTFQYLMPLHSVAIYRGNSVDSGTYPKKEAHDVVLIDGGHDYDTVLSDCRTYAPLATKYLLFHDIKLPDVARAVREFLDDYSKNKWCYREFVNSQTMGYGIVEIA